MRTAIWLVSFLTACGLAITSARAADTVIVYDASNSMWGQIEGESKISIARRVMGDLVRGWDDGTRVGLVAYGHRRAGDCSDIETVAAVGELDRDALITEIEGLQPTGKTPLTAAVQHAAEALRYRDNPATVILISDGIESCNADPCAASQALSRAGIRFTAHVVGFDVGSEEDQGQLRCIADNTGGRFFAARDAEGLEAALEEAAEIASEPEPTAPEVELEAPDQAVAGSAVPVRWTAENAQPSDLVTIAPAGDPWRAGNDKSRVHDRRQADVTAPGRAGDHEVLYVSSATGETVARRALTLTEPTTSVTAPETVTAGADLRVTWSESIHPEDYVTLVPVDSPDDEYDDYVKVRDGSDGTLTASATPGEYEARYVLRSGRRVLSRAPVTVTEARAGISAPAEVTAGTDYRVAWDTTVHPEDYVTLVPVDAPDDEYGDYVKVRDDSEGTLTAPGKPGRYEARYVLREDRSVLARVPVTVVEAEANVNAPEEVTAGSDFRVSWDTSVHPKDYVTLVPVDAPDDEYDDYVRVADVKEGTLTAPSTPGEYQARYVLRENRTVLARAPVKVTAAQSQVTAPEQVMAGAEFTVGWDTAVHPEDYVTIVPADAADSEYGDYTRANDDHEGSLVAPANAGAHEVRYVLRQDRVVLSRVPVQVVMPEVTVDGPANVKPGETFDVEWDTAVHRRDYVTIVPADAAADEYGDYVDVGSKQAGRLTAPEQPGDYEVRYVLREGRTPVGRLAVTVAEATD